MKNNSLETVMYALIRNALKQEETLTLPAEMDWEKVYQWCEYHKITGLVAYAIKNVPEESKPPSEILEKFQKKQQRAKAREAIQHVEQIGLQQAFEENGIDFIFLKGSVLKTLYPSPDMRYMTDMDILCKPDDIEKIQTVMESRGFQLEHPGPAHDVYTKKPLTVVEIHKHCYSRNETLTLYLEDVWNRSSLQEGTKHTYQMSWEDFYLFMVGHFLKHFKASGIGIRSLLDFWVFEETVGSLYDKSRVYQVLKAAGELQWEQKLNKLVTKLMLGSSFDESDETLLHFLWSSGCQGTSENLFTMELVDGTKTKFGAFCTYLLRFFRICFPKRMSMEKLYPYVKRYPFLLPVAWVHRGFEKLIFDREKIRRQFKITFRGLRKLLDKNYMKRINNLSDNIHATKKG